jgi:MYXO-CTERM domain-containing protein
VRRAVGVALLLGAASSARALPCNTPELLFTLPREGATGVPTDATLVAGYAVSADYAGEEVLLLPQGESPRPVPASFDRAQRLLTIKPAEALLPGTTYSVRWPALRGVDTATPGIGREIRFTTGAGPDAEAPRFDGLGAITWEVIRERNGCNDEVEDRFAFDLELGLASDDAGRDALALRVFQIGATTDQVLLRPLPAGTARLELPVGLAIGRICFAAQVQDLTGKTSDARGESCVETTAPPFFRGCAAGGAGGGGLPLLALTWLVARRRRRS